MKSGGRRRGLVLTIVLIVMTLTAGVLALIACWGVYRYRELQLDRVRLGAQVINDSALAYARLHIAEWTAQPPDSGIDLDVSSLAPRCLTASATVSVMTDGERRICRIATRVERGSVVATNEIDLPLSSPADVSPSTMPSTAPAVEAPPTTAP